MSNRFHSKFHRQNHHTYISPTNPDAGHDPIASPEQPFYGDFVLKGALSCVASPSAVAGYFYSDNTALCAIAGQTGQYIYSYGDIGLEVYSSQSTAITAYGPYYGANIRSNVFGINVYGGQYGVNTSSLVYGISSYGGNIAGAFYSPIYGINSYGGQTAGNFYSPQVSLSAFGGLYGADIYSPNYGINSYGGNAAGKFYSPQVSLSSYGGQTAGNFYSPQVSLSSYGGVIGLNVYSPLTAINSYGGQVAALLKSPVVSLSTGGGGVNRFDSRVGIFRTPLSSYPTSPNIVLDVNGNSYFDGSLTITGDLSTFGNLSYLDTIVYTTSSLRVVNHTASAGGTFIQYGTDYPTLVCYDGDDITTSSFTVLNKKVGINVDSPTNTFTVNSPITINDLSVGAQYAIALNNNGGTNGDLAFGSDSTNSYIQSFNSKPLQLNNIGTNNVIIGKNGAKVGIGTNTPNSTLTVSGDISASSNLLSQRETLDNTSNLFIGNDAILTINGKANQSAYLSLKNTYAGVSASSDISIYNDGSNYMDLGIASSTYNGNLYSPKFNIVKANDSYIYNTTSNLVIGTGATGDLVFFSGGTLSGTNAQNGNEKMRMTSGGNIGIGTSTPNVALTIIGDISASNNISTQVLSAYELKLQHPTPNDGNNPKFFIGEIGDGVTAGTILGSASGFNIGYDEVQNKFNISTIFGSVNPLTGLVIDQNANVGIGTTTPNVPLTVSGQISAAGSITALSGVYTIGNPVGVIPVTIKTTGFNFLGAAGSSQTLYTVPPNYTFVASTWSILITQAAGTYSSGTMPNITIANNAGSGLAAPMTLRSTTYAAGNTDLAYTFGGLQNSSTDIVKVKVSVIGTQTGITTLVGTVIVHGYLV